MGNAVALTNLKLAKQNFLKLCLNAEQQLVLDNLDIAIASLMNTANEMLTSAEIDIGKKVLKNLLTSQKPVV